MAKNILVMCLTLSIGGCLNACLAGGDHRAKSFDGSRDLRDDPDATEPNDAGTFTDAGALSERDAALHDLDANSFSDAPDAQPLDAQTESDTGAIGLDAAGMDDGAIAAADGAVSAPNCSFTPGPLARSVRQLVVGTPPAPVGGGPIADGTYVLTDYTTYQPMGTTFAGPGSEGAIEVSSHGTTLAVSEEDFVFAGYAAYSGTNLELNVACGPGPIVGMTAAFSYSYSGDSIVLFSEVHIVGTSGFMLTLTDAMTYTRVP